MKTYHSDRAELPTKDSIIRWLAISEWNSNGRIKDFGKKRKKFRRKANLQVLRKEYSTVTLYSLLFPMTYYKSNFYDWFNFYEGKFKTTKMC